MMRHRKPRLTFGKVGVKHGSTLVDNTGSGVGSFFSHVIYQTDIGVRSQSGNLQNIQQKSTTGNTIQVGDIVKYINVCIQCTPRTEATPIPDADKLDNCSWLEWALVFQRERDVLLSITNIGVATLGVLSNRFYREDCLMTGCFPIGTNQSMAVDLKFKLPMKCCRIKLGSILQIICYVRTSKSTDTRTESHRLVCSSQYKVYN